MERGVIENKKRAQQINDFSGLQYGNITPTDLDGLIEYKNKGYVLIEIKYKGKELPFGQRLAIERMVNDFACAGKTAIAIIADHYIDNTDDDVNVSDCNVRELYHSKERVWRTPKQAMTTAELIKGFIDVLERHQLQF